MTLSLPNFREIQRAFCGKVVNDVHSKLNLAYVDRCIEPQNLTELRGALKAAKQASQKIAVSGGRHAMGGQQFLDSEVLIDTSRLSKIIRLDCETGLVEVEGGIMWVELISELQRLQWSMEKPWTIAQKQTGGDNFSIGGSCSSNIHGRGLRMAPFAGDIESLRLLTAGGELLTCSRTENSELFKLVLGGYGLFGIIASVTMRLVPRRLLQRKLELIEVTELINGLYKRIADGAEYGDFQFAIDSKSKGFLTEGILSTYAPVAEAPHQKDKERLSGNKSISEAGWKELVYLAHVNKTEAFKKYSEHYLSTDGQLYESDRFQLSTYVERYHDDLDSRLPLHRQGSEMITELYVERARLPEFLKKAAQILTDRNADLIYGTVRMIEKDRDSFLAWAREPWACIVLNLHTAHDPRALEETAKTFRDLIDLTIRYGGNYYLTYHRYASEHQVSTCYPQIREFFKKKEEYDPNLIFSSNWYDHYAPLLAAS